MNSKIENLSAWVLALLMIIFGLNKFMGFIPVEPPTDPTAQKFMGAMFTTYLYIVVAVAEIIGGILLLFKRLRFIGWLILSTIIFNIVAFHIAHDFIGNGIWILPTVLFMLIGYFQLKHFPSLLKSTNDEI